MKKNYLNPIMYVISLNQDDAVRTSDLGVFSDNKSDFAEQDYFDLSSGD